MAIVQWGLLDFDTLTYFLQIVKSWSTQFLVIFVTLLAPEGYHRRIILEYFILISSLLAFKKYSYPHLHSHLSTASSLPKNLMIIGHSKHATLFSKYIQTHPQLGYRIIKHINHNSIMNDQFMKNDPFKNQPIDEVIIAVEAKDRAKIKGLVYFTETHSWRTKVMVDYLKVSTNNITKIGFFPLIATRQEPLYNSNWEVCKRVIDIFFSVIAFILIFWWLFPIIALLIKLDSKGNIFFVQARWGKNNQLIYCYKFRTMCCNSPEVIGGKFQQATANDCRITKVGKFLRKTNLDELPQFLNVLQGDMSIIGPRPHAVAHNLENQAKIHNYSIRHWVKPGISGWAQVNGLRGETKDFSLMRKRVEFDIWYIENWSLGLDFKILFLTIINMFKGDKMAY
jgi:putative colanic acid biosynthesis UDP-glucose lipid carrier transferase